MVFDVPLFAFGLFIMLLVAIGVGLAIAELRVAHAPRAEIDGRRATASKPRPGV